MSEREGHPIHYDKISTFDLLNFCQTARAHDAYMQLSEDISSRLKEISTDIIGECQNNLVLSLEQVIDTYSSQKPILFDDMRIAYRLSQKIDFNFEDGFELVIEARSVKTPEEIDLFRESGKKADRVMAHTVKQLGVGAKWCNIEKSVAHFMIDEGIDPLPTSPMLFGGSYDLAFRPDLFRTHFDSPFQEGQIAILENAIARYLSKNEIPGPMGSRHPSIAPFEAFKTKDSYIIIAAGNDKLFKNLCDVLKISEISDDKRFNTNSLRCENMDQLKEIFEKKLSEKNTGEWIKEMEQYKIPCGPIFNIKQAVENPQIQERNMVVKSHHKVIGDFKSAGNPIKLSTYKDEKTRGDIPDLDEHREKILKEFD